MNRPPVLLPTEITALWMDYLDQPDLLRVSAASKCFRAIVEKHKNFYLCIRLCSVREDARDFAQRVVAARPRGVQLAVSIDLPYALSRHSRSIFENRISTELERSMHLVRSLSIFLAAPLAPEFLLYPAPALRHFRFHIAATSHGWPEFDPYSSSDPDESSDSELGLGSDEEHAITSELFSGVAPLLTSLNLTGTKIPAAQVPAFARVSSVRLERTYSSGQSVRLERTYSSGQVALDFRLMFPSAQAMKLTGSGDGLFTTSNEEVLPPRAFSPCLVRLYLDETDVILARLSRTWDLSSVPHLHITYGTTSTYNWSPFLTHITSPKRLRVAAHLRRRNEGLVLDLTATLSSDSAPNRTLTFRAEPYDNTFFKINAFTQLGRHPVCDGLTWIELPRHYIVILFVIGDRNALPALRRLRILLDGPASESFWTNDDGDGLPLPGPHWAVLETLELASERRVTALPSLQVAAFATALGLGGRPPDHMPELVLDNVVITGGTHHEDFFSRCRTA